jgi:hypothetical protein
VPFEVATICAGLMEMLGNAGTFFDFRGAGRSLTKNSYGAKSTSLAKLTQAQARPVWIGGSVAFSCNAGIKSREWTPN